MSFENVFFLFAMALPYLIIAFVISFIVIGALRMSRQRSRTNTTGSSVSTLPEQRIWKWYLILVIIYYSILLLIQFLAGYEVIDTLGASMDPLWSILMIWPIFNIVVFIAILKNKIERKALLLPILTFPQLMLFSGFFSPFDIVSLGFAIYLLSRKQP